MKKYFTKSALLIVLTATLLSCGSKNDEVLNLTTDTTLALARINLDRIADKIPVDKILKEKKDIKEEEKFLLQLISKPKESGIDISKPLYIIVDAGKGQYEPDVKAYFKMEDKKLFAASMTKITKKKIVINDKDYILVDGKMSGSIKDNNAVIGGDFATSSPYESYDDEPATASKHDEKYFTAFWNRKGTSNSVIKDQVNQSLLADQDISGWANLSAIANFASKGYIETLAINKLIKDSGVGYNMNFDKGSAMVSTKSFFNDEMKKVVSKYYDKNKINYDLLKNINIDNANGFSIGYVSLNLIQYLIKEAGFEATINNYLSSTDKSLNDIISTFTGDYAFAEFKNTDTTDYYSSTKTAVVIGFNPKNKAVVDGLLKGPIFEGKKNLVTADQILFTEDNAILQQFSKKMAAPNKMLNKKTGITAYSYSDGKQYNTDSKNINVKTVVNETKEDKGNIISESKITLDKSDENALYYWILNA